MALRGCISVDRLALQILLKDNPEWVGIPVAVTRDEKPQSPILALNSRAREKGLAVGMRYSDALSLVPSLRARAVVRDRVEETHDRIVRLLASFTPDIELCPFDSDAVWVSVVGLRSLHGSESRWIGSVLGALAAERLRATIVLGFTRFGTYAMARTGSRSMVFGSRKEEFASLCRSSIDILPLTSRAKSTLRKLEVRTVKQFISLPEGEAVRRFGREAGLVRSAILQDDPLPIQPRAVIEVVPCTRHLDAPLSDIDMLMSHIDELLAVEARRAEEQKSVISGLTLVCRTEDGQTFTDVIRPAAPTLKTSLLGRLIRLRLCSRQFSSGVEDIEIRSSRAGPSRRQEELFTLSKRDLEAGARAFAAIRARFGNGSVAWARIADSHLPEKSFNLAPMKKPGLPAPAHRTTLSELPTAVRRVFLEPAQVNLEVRMQGESVRSFVVSGQWWGDRRTEAPFHREYSYRDMPNGILWLFFDKLTETCWVQGAVD